MSDDEAAEIARHQAQAEASRAEHWRKIALGVQQAENDRRKALGIPPLPIPPELFDSAKDG